ncbi:hypothetical protein G9A89_021771 [Geosiphon pyriformis]|nr:hypothetical protein G9A89_021771 [Geosiphon pyriformis]
MRLRGELRYCSEWSIMANKFGGDDDNDDNDNDDNDNDDNDNDDDDNDDDDLINTSLPRLPGTDQLRQKDPKLSSKTVVYVNILI